MALPVPGGDGYPPIASGASYYPTKRRTVHAHDDDNLHVQELRYKRPKFVQETLYDEKVAYKAADEYPFGAFPATTATSQVHLHLHHHHHVNPHRVHHHPHLSSCLSLPHPPPQPTQHVHPQAQTYQHHVPRQHPNLHHHRPISEPQPQIPIERTATGLQISLEPTGRCGSTELLDDLTAAQRVRDHLANFKRRNPDSKHERILRSIITPRTPNPPPLDNDSLLSIFSAANEIFFNGRLSQRVRWDWSHPSDSASNDPKVIGTTALRKAVQESNKGKGFETLIVLSSTILKDKRWSRRLLISTFLHELIHSYMFICCGFGAREEGGHTKGFREIAKLMDDWAGGEEGAGLYLGRVEADLELFRENGDGEGEEEFEYKRVEQRGVYPCSEWEGGSSGGRSQLLPHRHHYQGGGGHSGGNAEVVKYHHSSSNGSGGRNAVRVKDDSTAWWREQRVLRPGPVYVYTSSSFAEEAEMADVGFIRL
ncbi:hypothetical protein QBC38DRAFT_198393 [Podospora fimiseda]|uniref:SprT-like domain-containing protein n=1 Tax=Podospora fimiseda TaxID=252190 RepID=A0AAN7BQG1_9PEZI|nr:hypothetical protein QBC38DRAFT_198393 [Podospora fimiseda]